MYNITGGRDLTLQEVNRRDLYHHSYNQMFRTVWDTVSCSIVYRECPVTLACWNLHDMPLFFRLVCSGCSTSQSQPYSAVKPCCLCMVGVFTISYAD